MPDDVTPPSDEQMLLAVLAGVASVTPLNESPPAAPLSSNLDTQRAIANTAEDVRVPIFALTEEDNNKSLPAHAEEQDGIREACADAVWSPAGADDLLPVYLRLAALLPQLNLVPLNHDPNAAAFVWARARVLFAGAGFSNHIAIAELLTATYPLCPMDINETQQDWDDALKEAHKSCGWPVTLCHTSWGKITHSMLQVDENDRPDRWHLVVALMHVLKHVRATPDGSLAVMYRGTASLIQPEESNTTIGHWLKQQQTLMKALKCPTPIKRRFVHPMTNAVKQVLSGLSVSNLLPMQPVTDLPANVLCGPWSTVTADPSHMTGFFQTGLRLEGVWLAEKGRVRNYTGDQSDVLSFNWNIKDHLKYATARDELIYVMPRTYQQGWPADTFIDAFSNIDVSKFSNPAAAKVLLELPWFADVLRSDNHEFLREFPLVLFMPESPTHDQSTNQGKTLAAHTFGRVMVPTVASVGAPDTGSAPDSRAIASVIARYGTVVLDEWSPPRSKGHLLAHANLQMLLTGSCVASGRVLENTGEIKLKHTLVASAKAIDFPPDMVNRSFFWFMREFTTAELARHEIVARLVNGSLALEMKLQALAVCEIHDVMAKYKAMPRQKIPSLRFDDHAHLARVLYEMRTGQPETGELDRALCEMRATFASHSDTAETSGVAASLEDGGMTRLRLSSLLFGLDGTQMTLLETKLEMQRNEKNRGIGKWNTVGELAKAVAEVRGKQDLQSMLQSVTAMRGRPTERVIVQALSTDVRSVIAECGSWPIPDTGYCIERGKTTGHYLPIKITKSVTGAASGVVAPVGAPP